MSILYKFSPYGEWFECKTPEDLKSVHNYDEIHTIYCYANHMDELSTRPHNLSILQCFDNGRWRSVVPYLPALPESKPEPSYYYHHNNNKNNNKLTVLPDLPNGITYLHCAENGEQ